MISQLHPLGGPGISDTSVAAGTLSAQILASKCQYPIKGTEAPYRKMVGSRLGQKKCKMNRLSAERKSVQKTKGWGAFKGTQELI